MSMLVLFLLAVGPTAFLEMSVSGPAAEVPGLAEVRAVAGAAPVFSASDLPLMPGWPVKVAMGSFSPTRGVALADLDGDGRQEVILATSAGQVHVWRYDGSYFPGWPVSVPTGYGQYTVSVADVDRDGSLDIAVGTRVFTSGSGPVYLFDTGGNIKPGWPFAGAGGYFNEAPTLADIDGDDTLEIIIAERVYPLGYLYVLRHDGRVQPGAWPCTLDHVPATGASVADLDGDGTVEIVQASYNSLYVFQPDGSVRPGWPRTMPDGRNWSYQSPALADIDGDDTLEIVTAMHKEGGGAYVFRHDGTTQPGWPRSYSNWTYCPPTVADLYRDGDLKVLCGVSAGLSGSYDILHAHDDDGSSLPGFPFVSQTGSNEPNLTVADIDGDGDMEIIFTSNRIASADSLGYVYALHHDGAMVAGFPLRPWGFTYLNGPNVADVNGDGMMDIVAVSSHANRIDVTIWETGVRFDRQSWEWPTYQFDMARTGWYRSPETGVAEAPSRPAAAARAAFGTGRVRFALAGDGPVRAELYDPTGRRLARLFDGRLSAGEYELALPAGLGRGVVLLRLDCDGRMSTTRLVVLR